MRTVAQRRGADSTQRMIDATVELLAEGGLTAVTVAAVARRAGASNGSLYHRFGDREGLLRAVQDHLLTAMETEALEIMDEAAQLAPSEAASTAVRAALRLFDAYRPVLRAFFVEGQQMSAFADRNARCLHLLAARSEAVLVDQLGFASTEAAAMYRVLFSVGAARSLFTEDQMRAEPLAESALEDVLIRLAASSPAT